MPMFDATLAGALVAAVRVADEKDRRSSGLRRAVPQREAADDGAGPVRNVQAAARVGCVAAARRTWPRLWPRPSPRAF